MSLPPYKHTRNPALEKENEFHEYKSWQAPLIIYDGIIEKRKTTDLKLVRNQPRHPGIELEYLSPFSVEKSQPSAKNQREDGRKTGRSESRDEPIKIKSARKDNELENKMVSDESTHRRNREQLDDAKSTRSGLSTKTRESASRESLISRSSAKSSSTGTYRIIEKIPDEPTGSLKSSKNREPRGFTPKSRYSANGLDEDDQFRR